MRNRSPEELEAGTSFEEVKQKEKEEFEQADLQFLPPESRGTEALIHRLVALQRQMVLGHRHKFKEDLQVALRKRQTEINELPPCCSTDVEKSNLFKDCVSNFQRDTEFLSNGDYHMV